MKLAVRAHLQIPRINPRQSLAVIKAGFAECAAARLLRKMKLLRRNIGHGEVRELQIVRDEARSVWRALVRRADSLPEKRDLKTEPAAVRLEQITGEIPPLGLEFRMRMMIARELVIPARLGC